MKSSVIMIILLNFIVLLCAMPAAWTAFQKDIGIQAAAFQNTPEQQIYKQQNNARSYVVGDTHIFWKWSLAVMPPVWVQSPATCRAVGEHCYVFVADSDWNSHMTQANVDSVMVRLEQNTPNNPTQGAIEMDINLFGPIPDALDNDEKLIVFYSALGSFQGTSFDGYFSAYNQVTESQAQQMDPPGHSNLCEMIYMTCYPLPPTAAIRLSVLSHELEHLIHWGQDANEESWIDEGCAELAMVAYGVPDPISGFNSNPDNDLTFWDQQTADYVKVMLFFTYLKEHYDETGMIRDLVADPANGMTSFNNQAEIHYPFVLPGQILQNWTIANAIDAVQPGDSLYNYEELDIPTFTMYSINQHPSLELGAIQSYAADYLKYDLPANPTFLNIDANTAIYMTLLVLNSDYQCIEVIDCGLTNSASFNPLPDSAQRVVIILTNHTPNSVNYSYETGTVGNTDEHAVAFNAPALNCYPNPLQAGTALEISFNDAKNVNAPGQVDIYNLKGQKIRHLNAAKSAGTASFKAQWDGTNDRKEAVSNGIYLLRYSNGNKQISKKIYVVK